MSFPLSCQNLSPRTAVDTSLSEKESYQLEHYKDRVEGTMKMLSCNRFIINSYRSLLTLKVIDDVPPPHTWNSPGGQSPASMFFPPDRVRTCVQVNQMAPEATTTVRTWQIDSEWSQCGSSWESSKLHRQKGEWLGWNTTMWCGSSVAKHIVMAEGRFCTVVTLSCLKNHREFYQVGNERFKFKTKIFFY